jgi:hypothetical protein
LKVIDNTALYFPNTYHQEGGARRRSSAATTGSYGRSGSMSSYPGFGASSGRNIDMSRFVKKEKAELGKWRH